MKMIKTTTKKMLLSGLAALGLFAFAGGVAHAGFKGTYPVRVFPGSSANGSLGSARSSADSAQYIGCQLYIIGSPASASITCDAVDSTNHYIACTTTNTLFFPAIEMMTANSWLSFNVDAGGKCTVINVDNESYVQPVAP